MLLTFIGISGFLLLLNLMQYGQIENLRNKLETQKDSFYFEKNKLLSMISWFSSYRILDNGEIELIEMTEPTIIENINNSLN